MCGLACLHSKSIIDTTKTTEKNKTSFSASLISSRLSTLKYLTFFILGEYLRWMKVQIDGRSKFCNILIILFNTGKK